MQHEMERLLLKIVSIGLLVAVGDFFLRRSDVPRMESYAIREAYETLIQSIMKVAMSS